MAAGGDVDSRSEVDAEQRPVLERLQRLPAPGRRLAEGAGERANRLRIQERVVMGSLLPVWVGPRYNGRTTIRAQTGRTGAVGPVRGLLGGTTSPAAPSIPERAASRGYRTSAKTAPTEGQENLKFFPQ